MEQGELRRALSQVATGKAQRKDGTDPVGRLRSYLQEIEGWMEAPEARLCVQYRHGLVTRVEF